MAIIQSLSVKSAASPDEKGMVARKSARQALAHILMDVCFIIELPSGKY
jgi:hypothetical protein